MQTPVDGEFYPEKNLDKNYKIPKKNPLMNICTKPPASSFSSGSNNATPLANSYYNYHQYNPGTYYQYFQDYNNPPAQGLRNSLNFNLPPPPPPPALGVEPITQNIFNALRDIKEKPKKYGKNIYNNNVYEPEINSNRQDYIKQTNAQQTGNEGYNNCYPESKKQEEFNHGSKTNIIKKEVNNQQYYNNAYKSDQYFCYNPNQSYSKAHFGNKPYDTSRYSWQDFGQSNSRKIFNDGTYRNEGLDTKHLNPSGRTQQTVFGNPGCQEFKRANYQYNPRKFQQSTENSCFKNKVSVKSNTYFQQTVKSSDKYEKKTVPKTEVQKVQVPVEQTVPDLLDDSLPKDLKILFQPLFCKLCSAQLSSNQTAKMHYKSRNHEKKIRKWLVDWSEQTGEPLHKRALVTGSKKDDDAEKNPTWFHCEICDLELTGRMHAESHYMGKNHQKALLGHKNPAGHGYYKDGKWVRVKGQKSKAYNFQEGEDNFGMDFKQSNEKTEASDESTEPPVKKRKESESSSKFHCDVCNINATCQEQLDTHFRGQKHVKKLKALGIESSAEQRKQVEATGQTTPLSSPLSEQELVLSVYRTPSGDYYCPTCNLIANSDSQFIQHMKSKGHAKKAAEKKSSKT